MRWFNLNTGITITILVIIIILFAMGMGIVGYSLWNVPKAKELFPFLEISEAFPTKVTALFTTLLAGATFLLAIAAFWSIRENRCIQEKNRIEERHRMALERIRSWGEDTFEIVSKPAPPVHSPKFLGLLWQELRPAHTKSIGILSDAEQLGGDIDAELKRAQFCLSWFIARLMGENESLSFREYFKIEDVVEPIRSIEELSSAKKEVMKRLLIVIQSATKLLVPQR